MRVDDDEAIESIPRERVKMYQDAKEWTWLEKRQSSMMASSFAAFLWSGIRWTIRGKRKISSDSFQSLSLSKK